MKAGPLLAALTICHREAEMGRICKFIAKSSGLREERRIGIIRCQVIRITREAKDWNYSLPSHPDYEIKEGF